MAVARPKNRGTRRRTSARPPLPPTATTRSAPSSSIRNEDIARIFGELADLLQIQDANPFRVRAYRTAARVVGNHPEPVAAIAESDPDRLTELTGIGADLAGKIVEIVRTGTLAALRDAEKAAPRGASELMRIPGLGPKRARRLASELGLHTREDLEHAIQKGTLDTLPGFGEKSAAKLLRDLSATRKDVSRTLRAVAEAGAEALRRHLADVPGVRQVEIAGSYRRRLETVGDLDVLVTGDDPARVIAAFVAAPSVAEVIARGTTRAAVRLRGGLQVDLRVLPPESFGAGLYYFTGSKAHNIALRRVAQAKGWKLNEYGLWNGTRRIAGASEEELFAKFALPWIPPELREDRGEFEAARAGALPKLLEVRDLRGDLQMHTTDSDGRDSLAQMAAAARARGYEWMAVTDHSPAVRVARGMDAAGFRRQARRIDALNATLDGFTVLKGAEVDILADGSLDLDDDALSRLDVVLVSIHSQFDLAPAEQTRRVLRALANPNVDIFAHPTGRRIGRRQGARFDFEAVCRLAKERGVILEVNGQPERLDLDDTMCHAAIDHGVRISIGSDAHATGELALIRFGVDQARRGWAQKKNVVNTLPLSKLRRLLHGTRG